MAKILLMGEATWHKTGYSNYGKNILEGLQAKGHEVAEVAAFGRADDHNSKKVPWKVYLVDHDPNNAEETHIFNTSIAPATGSWKFEYALVDFMPDYVISFRDPWIDRFIYESPLRKYFNWIYMPTCDAIPFDNNWINAFQDADGILTYSTWAFKELQKLSKINLIDVAPSGAEKDIFKPLDKDIKKGFGIPSDTFVVGTVMRNQERKLFPGLFRAFRKFLNSIPKEQAAKTKLLCHTSYPDVGWDIPRMLVENNVEDNVYFTQICLDCKQIFVSKWAGPCKHCPSCGSDKTIFPNTSVGVSREQLNLVYNAMDFYVQYANCLTPNQKVLTSNGWVNTEDVQVGDLAWTHKGRFKKVLNTFSRKVDSEKVYKIKCHSDIASLEVTGEHPIWAIKARNVSRSARELLGDGVRDNKKLPEPEWVEAKDLSVGDIVVFEINKDEIDYNKMDLSKYIDSNYVITDDGKQFSSKFGTVFHEVVNDLDDDFYRWIGLYAADGTFNNKKYNGDVRICCHIDQKNCIDLAHKVMGKFGNIFCVEYHDRQALDVCVSNKVFAKYMEEHCLKHEHKKLPDWIMWLPIEKQKLVLQGLFMGDGGYFAKKNTSNYSTISPVLAQQISWMLKRVGVTYGLSKAKKSGNRKDQYRFEVRGRVSEGFFDESRKNTRSLNYNGKYYRLISKIDISEYTGEVYNFEVEGDNSYASELTNIHNCEGLGMPQIEAAYAGLVVSATNYSAMESVVRELEGIPIQVSGFYRESSSHREMAVPSDDDFVSALKMFTGLSLEERKAWGQRSMLAAHKHFDYQKSIDVWDFAIKSIPKRNNWLSPPDSTSYKITHGEDTNFNNIKSVFKDINLNNGIRWEHMELLRSLNREFMDKNSLGIMVLNDRFAPFSKQNLVSDAHRKLERLVFWEKKRIAKIESMKGK